MINMGNDFIATEYAGKIDKVLDENYLKEVNINEGIKELCYLKDKLKKYKFDFICYFYKECLIENKVKKEKERYARQVTRMLSSDDNIADDAFLVLMIFLVIVAIICVIWHLFAQIPIFNKLTAIIPTAIVLGGVCIIPPRIPNLIRTFRRYGEVTNSINDKLSLLTERKEDLILKMAKNSKKTTSIDKVDSFIKLIISYKDELDTLSEKDSERIKFELVKLGREYLEYAVKGSKDGLEINDTMLKFNNRLTDIELEIERLKQNTTKTQVNESALEEAFGVDITKLDTSSVELNFGLDSPKLNRDLKK